MENKNEDIHALDKLLDLVAERERSKSNEAKNKNMIARARKRYRKLYLAYGSAGIAILSVVIILIARPWQQELNSLQLFEKNYTRHHFDYEYRSSDSVFESFSEAVKVYESGKTDQCVTILNQLISAEPDKTDYQLLMGLALIDSGKYEDAITWLIPVSKQGGTYEPVSLWYQGLCFLALDQRKQAIKCLTKISKFTSLGSSKRVKKVIKDTKRL